MPDIEPTNLYARMSLRDLLDIGVRFHADFEALLHNPRIVEARQNLQMVDEELTRRALAIATAQYETLGKTEGSLTIKPEPGVRIKADISKTVKYDQTALKALAYTLDWLTIRKLFKITFEVPEATYKALLPGPIKDAVEKARTTTYGKMKATVESAVSAED